MKILTFKIGGIHPPENKTTPADKIVDAGLPLIVNIPLQQSIGAEAKPIVKMGEHVNRGQKIGEAAGKISAPVHASISGTVKSITAVRNIYGKYQTAITIAASDADHETDLEAKSANAPAFDYSALSPKEILEKISEAGIVGLGGATFPSAVKLAPATPAQVLIINACECEPCLTCDDALMRAYPAEIVEGIALMLRASGAPKAIIGIENNKPEAFEALSRILGNAKYPNIEIQLLKTKYPQGGEKQLIYALTRREVPSGALPISVGAIVQNVATAYAVYQAVALGQPLIERVATIEGCANFMVSIGMAIKDIPADWQTKSDSPLAIEADVVAGGPMMGRTAINLEGPITKGFSGLTEFAPLPFAPEPCVRCGDCASACPMGLEPFLIATYGRLGRAEDAKKIGAMDCIECGSCSYSCPSARPILDFIKLAKREIRKLPK